MPQAPDRTRDRILAAAYLAFAEVGFAGARVDAIARGAGCNKQLIYHYFTDKQGLYEAVMRDVLSRRMPVMAEPGVELAEHFLRTFRVLAQDRAWFRLLTWEALERGDAPIAAEEFRRAHADAAAAQLGAALTAGKVDASIPARFLLLALMGAATIPLTLPQVARLITGLDPNDPAFLEQYGAALARLVGRLRTPAP